MANLTAKKDRCEKRGRLVESPLAAEEVFTGSLMKHNAAGYAAKCAAEAGAVFAGVAYESVDNSAGSAGDKKVRIEKKGNFIMDGAGFSQANVGSEVYASDDNTISTTQGADEQAVGAIVEYISATQVRVRIDNYAV